MWFLLTEDETEVERIFQERLLPTIRREEIFRDRQPVGSPERFAEKLLAYRDAGVLRVFILPVADELRQRELSHDTVASLIGP